MRLLEQYSPGKLVLGPECAGGLASEVRGRGVKKVLLITAPVLNDLVVPIVEAIEVEGVTVTVEDSIVNEPNLGTLAAMLEIAAEHSVDGVIGIGGGSVLDVAKAVAGLHGCSQKITDVIGDGLLATRSTYLACLPTTSGTGSEVSPNAIFTDESDNLKKAIISPFIVPDAVFVDPTLTVSVPPHITASSGIDALSHCMEAFTNKFAHPLIDVYAQKGMQLISKSLRRAVKDGNDIHARTDLALGSMLGGMCLGPVNTAAVHALAYPLQGKFKKSHGLSIAVMLPYVMDFNLVANRGKYALVAEALGVETTDDISELANKSVVAVRQLTLDCGVPQTLSEIGIPAHAIDELTEQAMTVSRLLDNNPREMNAADARAIFEQAF
jgi:alcohol dehydrogenase class IV|tara:strand:+ start:7237 stop:8382 length:1146 start_codon:yes stop_codon:yes gene_type:complete